MAAGEPLEITEEIVLACGASCSDHSPSNPYDLPLCSEYELNTALIESAAKGDASSIALLRSRHETADTYSERHRIAGALLRTSSDDAKFWNELVSHAEIAVRFPHVDYEMSPEYLEWCAKRGIAPDEYWYMAFHALEMAGADPRSRPLLLRALASNDGTLLIAAVEGLGKQRHFASLPLIERAFARVPEDAAMLAMYLARFADERADALAMKYLGESDLEAYREWRSAAQHPAGDPR